MKSVDRNVVVRLIVRDDPRQRLPAQRWRDAGFFVPLTVGLETACLPEARYDQSRGQIALRWRPTFDLLTVDDPGLLQRALDRHATGAEIADTLHLVASARREGFAAFDPRIAAEAGPAPPLPTETLH